MKRIYKYPIDPQRPVVQIPSDGILSVASQGVSFVAYAIVDEDDVYDADKLVTYEFAIYGTGHKLDIDASKYTFAGTVKMMDDTLMFHVFYRKV